MHLFTGEYIQASGEGACGIRRCREKRGVQYRRKADELLNAAAEELAMETGRHWTVDAGRREFGRMGREGGATEIW